MVVGGAAQEGSRIAQRVADLEAEAVAEERGGRPGVGGAQDGVPQLAGPHAVGAHDARGPARGALGASGPVVRGGGRRGRGGARFDLEHGPGAGDGVGRGQARPGAPYGGDAHAAQPGGGRVEVVGVVDADAHLDEATGGRRHDAQLATAVAGGEPAVVLRPQAEFGVVRGCRRGVGDPDGDGGQAVQ